MALRPPRDSQRDLGGRVPTPLPARSPVVVVADDDEVTRERLAAMLREAGHTVETAPDGQDAIDRVARGGVDLVLLDATMPRVSGLEACRVLKGMTEQAFVPVLSRSCAPIRRAGSRGSSSAPTTTSASRSRSRTLLARVAAMLRIKRLYDEMQAARATLERVSVHDELTGLYNYRYLHTRLAEEFKKAERQHEPLACCMLDIDRLKADERSRRPRVRRRGAARRRRRDPQERARERRRHALRRRRVPDRPAVHSFRGLARGRRAHLARRRRAELGSARRAGARHRRRSASRSSPAATSARTRRSSSAAELALLQAKREGGERMCVFQQQGFIYTPGALKPTPDEGNGA